MAEATRSREISENLKKHEILLMEERSERLAAEQHINNQLERMVSIQAGLQALIASIENFQKGMQQQMQMLNVQMHNNNRGKSILGEGQSMAAERGSNSNIRRQYLCASFVSGLRDDIRRVVMSMKPNDFHQAVTLARKQEGTTDMNTLRIKGSVKGQDVHILIDSGSTHCFLDENTAHKLGCKTITLSIPSESLNWEVVIWSYEVIG
ncbi:hypothetical protein BUALT_Bualt15G0109700 [Buddleja alternifolia]|uniref:Uncharacterized protein n=1 Tax=Buddleja alternifolia TaxID=168488 RepID=A0AAV6WNA7_9LAMI|nr:hypothetical protein BUALT_Bualt15G0109700 [Buddleja alternifolia]